MVWNLGADQSTDYMLAVSILAGNSAIYHVAMMIIAGRLVVKAEASFGATTLMELEPKYLGTT